MEPVEKVSNHFQKSLQEDIKSIDQCEKALIFADKSRNLYEVDKETYGKSMMDNITKSYKKAGTSIENDINKDAKDIAKKLKISDRIEILPQQQAFITLKDHKDNFQNNPKCRLINPAKSEMGVISKQILERVNTEIRKNLSVNQWRNTSAVIEWFKNIQEKDRCTFTVFDIEEFYPSISEKLLDQSIEFAKNYTEITDDELRIIHHARKSLLFDKNEPWVKKNSRNAFDVTMGSYDGAEICELVGLLILFKLSSSYNAKDIGLYRDDGLSVFKNNSGPETERIKKDITKIFKELGLKITIQCNLKIVNFLDVTLDLNTGKYHPYKKTKR